MQLLRNRPLLAPLACTAGQDSSEGGSGASATASFTKNTALVLEHLRREFAPATGSKRRHPSAGDLAAGVASLSLDGLLGAGQEAEAAGRARRGRLEAARWFYESLVLRSTSFVTLTQVGSGPAGMQGSYCLRKGHAVCKSLRGGYCCVQWLGVARSPVCRVAQHLACHECFLACRACAGGALRRHLHCALSAAGGRARHARQRGAAGPMTCVSAAST